MAAQSSALSLKEYLKRYQSCADESKTVKKKKKEKLKPKCTGGGVHVVDEDPVWQKSVQLVDEEEDNFIGDETPQIEEDIEVKRMKRLEALRSLKPYHGISEDGSGWVPIPKPSRPSASYSGDLSPQHSQHDSRNTDLSSAPHQRWRHGSFDTTSPEAQFNGPGMEADDISPPRRRRAEDLSPPRRAKFQRQEAQVGRGLKVADPSLTRSRKPRKGPADDLSPPRQYQESTEADHYLVSRTKKESSEDLSPPRQARSSPAIDLSPPRRTTKQFSGDLPPPLRKQKCSLEPNLPLPPRARDGSSESSRNIDMHPSRPLPPRNKEPPLTMEARRGGLLSAKEMREEIDRKKMDEKSRFASMDPLLTGRAAEPVHRDKEGKRISKEELKKPMEEKKQPKPLEWGKGLAQKREAEGRGKELELEKDKPFARSRDDPELDVMLKERIRWGDPMAHLVKRKASELILEDFGENEKMKESGFIIPQAIPSHSWLKRGLDFPPNRFGIRPGRHWDGLDRSTGYENQLFKSQNEKRANEAEAYLWSVSDM